jgi:hypothetical protein
MATPERIATQKQTLQNLRTPLPVRVAEVLLKQQPALGQDVDALLELRSLIKKAGEQERILTQSILGTLSAAGLDTFSGAQATAVLGSRTVLTPDPQLFLESVGQAAFGALRVALEPARQLMTPADLEAISETVTGPVLRVLPRKAA